MNLMNKDQFIKSLQETITPIKEENKDFNITFKTDSSREESAGSLTFIFSIKNAKEARAKDYKISMYIFESRKCITTFIVNGRTLKLLFENSTMDSPTTSLHYLKDILLSEIKFIKDVEESVRSRRLNSPNKKFGDKRKSHDHRDSSYRKETKSSYGYNKKPYVANKKSYGSHTSNTSVKKSYNKSKFGGEN